MPAGDRAPDGDAWPLISVVTPSLNQAKFLEETIRSVLLQGYPQLEYFVMDGGSTDGSVDVIRKYEPWLAGWVSEPDEGQSDALNKGWKRSTGELLGWLNSDDLYLPGGLRSSAAYLVGRPDVALVYRDCPFIDGLGRVVERNPSPPFDFEKQLLFPNLIPQPSVLFRRRVLDEVGFLDPAFRYAMDHDFWLRIGLKLEIAYEPGEAAAFRMQEHSKTVTQAERFWPDVLEVTNRAFASPDLPEGLRGRLDEARSNIHLERGKERYAQGQLREARSAFLESLRLDPRQLLRSNLLVMYGTSLLGQRFCRLLLELRKRQLRAAWKKR